MDKTPDTDSKSWKHQLLIAKLLLKNYGILHEFHARQIECYLVACCPSALDGVSEIDADSKSVTYNIYTSRFFKRAPDKKIQPKDKWERRISSLFGKSKYKQELELATINLSTWTKELLWGEETKIGIVIDGQQIK